MLDRLTHRCHILEIGNDSFRFKNSSAKAAKPAKEKSRNLTNAWPRNHHQAGSVLDGNPGSNLIGNPSVTPGSATYAGIWVSRVQTLYRFVDPKGQSARRRHEAAQRKGQHLDREMQCA